MGLKFILPAMRAKLLCAVMAIAMAPLATAQPVAAASQPRTTVAGLPYFFELVLDPARNRVYGSDPGGSVYALDGTTGHQIWMLSFGQYSRPSGMDISPDGSTLAVAVSGLHHIQLVNLADGTAGSALVPANSGSDPYDVKYGRAGRLYSVGNGAPDYLHVFDTTTGLEVSTSTSRIEDQPRLAITADHASLYVMQVNNPLHQLEKFDVSTDSVDNPVEDGGSGSEGLVIATTPDGSKVFTNGGQMWDSSLHKMLGKFQTMASNLNSAAAGVSYAAGKIYVSAAGGSQVAVVDATSFPFNLLGTIDLSGIVGASQVNAAGTRLYVSTGTEFDIVDLSQPLTPPPSRPTVQPYASMVLDEGRGVLYASDYGAGQVRVISATDGSLIDSIDVGAVNVPAGMDISPDGSRLAVVLTQGRQIAVINLATLAVVGHLYTDIVATAEPSEVRYGRSGRLYEASRNWDAIHVFDTSTGLEVGHSWGIPIYDPRLAISPDGNTLYEVDNAVNFPGLYAIDVTTDSPPTPIKYYGNTARGDLAVSSDGTQLYVSGGPLSMAKVYSSNLSALLGTPNASGTAMAYSASANRLFLLNNSNGFSSITSVVASSPYAVDIVRPITAASPPFQGGPIDVNTAGTVVYVSTAEGVYVIPWGSPEPPTNVSAVHGNAQATVSWSAPSYTGTSAISGYTVTSSPGGISATVGGSTLSAAVTGLTNGTSYRFTVQATNAAGTSRPSAQSNPVTPRAPTVPTAPLNPFAFAGHANASVSWASPVDDGDSAITSYTVTSSPGGQTATTADRTTLQAVVRGLTPGTSYTFTIKATNGIGDSPPSAASNAVTPTVKTVPSPPQQVTATPGDRQATVTWGAPSDDGGSAISAYTVTSSPGSFVATVSGSQTSAVVSGLANGTTYTFTVVATNATGDSSPSNPSDPVTVGVPTEPRDVYAAAGLASATVFWTAPIGTGGFPIISYTIHSSGGATATVSATSLSAIIAGLSASGHTFTVTAANVNGSGPPSAPTGIVTPADGAAYNPLVPKRILDTRNGNGGAPIRRVPANTAINLKVTGRGGVPLANVSAVVLNVTVTGPTGSGYVTAYPYGWSRPRVSNLNFVAGQTVPNLVEVPIGSGGRVSLFVAGSSANLVADVEGWVGDSTNSYTRAGLFDPLRPSRILDTRTGNGAPLAKLGPGHTLVIQVTGAGGVPATGVAAVVMNVTVTRPTQASYLTVYPTGAARPLASNLNFGIGQTVANRVIVPVGSGGMVSIFNASGSTDVIVDVNGWFTDASSTVGGSGFVAIAPQRIVDTRSGLLGRFGPGDVLDVQFLPNPPVTALVLNLTATNETGSGYLTAYPDDGSFGGGGAVGPPLSSDVNYRYRFTVPNMVVVGLGPNLAFNIANEGATTDFVVDLDGYYGADVSAPSAALSGSAAPSPTKEPSRPSSSVGRPEAPAPFKLHQPTSGPMPWPTRS